MGQCLSCRLERAEAGRRRFCTALAAARMGLSPNAGLIFDTAGNLYGTTYLGGIHGFGTVFEMSPKQGGSWTEMVLQSFNLNGTDGAIPWPA